jgi:glyoxylase-like metal-dependent hydrolase (beta-lactamase superfamily II)
MAVTIFPIPLGFDCCYLVKERGVILIDAGLQGQAGRLKRALDRLRIRPGEIQLMVITHGHFDHIGSAKAIKDLTGAKLAMHQPDADWLEHSVHPRIPGVTSWGRFLAKPLNWPLPITHAEPAKVDIFLGDEDWPLDEYGICGRVLFTPGHTLGSVSVLLETGEAFVGDLAMNRIPLRLAPGFPVLAEDMDRVRRSWAKLLDAGVRMVYPAHGKPFPSDIIRRALRREALDAV